MSERLLSRIKPKINESFSGFTSRLAKSNYITPNDLLLFTNEKLSFATSNVKERKSLANLLVKLTGFYEIESLFDVRIIQKKYKTLFDFDVQKICLCCLEEEQYIRDIWDFRNYVICHKHHNVLLSHCSSCSQKISTMSAIIQKCEKCSQSFRSSNEEGSCKESLSNSIAQIFDGSENSISEIAEVVGQIQPFLRLANEGRYEEVVNLRKNDLVAYAKIQAKASELVVNKHKSISMLASQLAPHVKTEQWLRSINGYRKVINEPEQHDFASVLKETLVGRSDEVGGASLSYELISKLWKIDLDRLSQAIIEVVPPENLIKTGRHKIRCLDFAKYQQQIRNKL